MLACSLLGVGRVSRERDRLADVPSQRRGRRVDHRYGRRIPGVNHDRGHGREPIGVGDT